MPALRIAGIDPREESEEEEMALWISSSLKKRNLNDLFCDKIIEKLDEKKANEEESKCEEERKKVKVEMLQTALLWLKLLVSQDCRMEG